MSDKTNTKIRILNIQETMSSGGVERRRLSIAKLLNREVFDLKIICNKGERNMMGEFQKNDVEVISIGKLKHPFEWRQHLKVQKIINEYKPHIIHGAVFEGVTLAAINGFVKNVPIVILEETSDPQNRSWRGNLLMKFLCAFADKVVGVSPASVEYLSKKLKLPLNKVHLINNGVAVPRVVVEMEKLALKKELKITDSDIIIGSVGRMGDDNHKRFSDLIKAFAMVSRNYSNAKLLIIGDGKDRVAYETLSKDLGISEKVMFAGFQADVTVYYSIMDIFSLVSGYEAFGLVLAEAMLHKLPIVATRVGGMKYIVDDSVTGFLVEKFDVDQIALKLSMLCKDVELRLQMGENGYLKAISEYTEEIYVSKVDKLYRELLKEKSLI